MPIDLFGFSIGRKQQQSSVPKGKTVSFVPPEPDDGATVIESGNFFGQYIDFDGNIRSDVEQIGKYREMSLHAEVDAAIDDIVNESIVQDDIKDTVQILLDGVDLPDPIKDKVEVEFDNVMKLLHFNSRGHEIFRKWYIDSKLYFHILIDENNKKKGVLEVRPIDATKIRKVRKIEKDKGKGGVKIVKDVEEFFVYTDEDRLNPEEGIKVAPDSIVYVHSGMFEFDKKRVYGYLHKGIKPLNQLRMIEDAVVIYRIARAPERRIFYIDVGSLPKNKAEQYLRDIMNRYRNKLVYDASTGEMRDDKRHMSMLEDFWLPRREGGRGTEIDTLSGGENLGEMDDVEYFKKKLYRALNVPITRLEADNGFNMGRASEINRDELKFFKFIEKIRVKFSDLFIQMLRVQLLLKGIMREEEWVKIKEDIKFEFARDSYFTELKNNEILRERMDLLGQMNDYIGKYYSLEFIRKSILHQTSEEIDEMDKQIQSEREQGLLDTQGSQEYY
jgi:hypothetical protein